MIKTQHCPNCEATEQELSDFRQEVSDALVIYSPENRNPALGRFIIAKPDPLVEVMKRLGWYNAETDAADLRVTLADFGLEIRSKANAHSKTD